MYLLESYVSVEHVVKTVRDLSCNESLDLRKLERQRYSEQEGYRGDKCQPEYFQNLFDDSRILCVQLANLIKISDKFRIFAVCNEA